MCFAAPLFSFKLSSVAGQLPAGQLSLKRICCSSSLHNALLKGVAAHIVLLLFHNQNLKCLELFHSLGLFCINITLFIKAPKTCYHCSNFILFFSLVINTSLTFLGAAKTYTCTWSSNHSPFGCLLTVLAFINSVCLMFSPFHVLINHHLHHAVHAGLHPPSLLHL